jgi:hypothetical protein
MISNNGEIAIIFTYSYLIVSVYKASHPLQRWQLDSCDWIAACCRTFVYMEATGAQGNAALLSHRLTLQVGEIITLASACRVMADRLDVYSPFLVGLVPLRGRFP